MFPAESRQACHSLANMMEVGDNMQSRDPALPYPTLLARDEQIDQQLSGMKHSVSSLMKESHTQSCSLGRVSMGASDEKHARTPAATVEDLEIQFSEACHKSFVIFDQCGGEKTLVCHPGLLNSGPSLVLNAAKNTNDYFGYLQDISDKAAEDILNTCPLARPSAWGERLLAYRETMEAAFAALEKGKANGFDCSGFKLGGHSLMACLNPVEDSQNKSRISRNCACYDFREGIESPLHENTEDIDALLSSDDDLSSTGHSLIELNVENVSMPTDGGDDQSSSNPRKKRKIQETDLEENADGDFLYGDADSGQSRNPQISEVSLSNVNGFWCRKKLLCEGSPRSLLRQSTSQDRGGIYERNTKFLEDIWFAKRSKLTKIEDTFEELKNAIPGGDCLNDTVSVLDKAVHYIKTLQVKLQKLEALKEIQLDIQ